MKRSPLPMAIFAVGVMALVFSGSSAIVIVPALLGTVALFFLARHRASLIYLVAGTISGLGLVALTPFVGSDAGTVLVRGPEFGVIDSEITLQELGAGAVDGARLLTVALLFGVVLANIDTDRLHALVGRFAPRSALIVALSVRLLPTLERDGILLAESARARGLALSHGSWISRARRAAPLTTPLVGSALERGIDIAEAMEARGYSGGRLSDAPSRVNTEHDVVIAGAGVALAVLTAAALAGPPAPYIGLAGLVMILVAAWVVRR